MPKFTPLKVKEKLEKKNREKSNKNFDLKSLDLGELVIDPIKTTDSESLTWMEISIHNNFLVSIADYEKEYLSVFESRLLTLKCQSGPLNSWGPKIDPILTKFQN